jgi:CheY-like chemotaxis protein
MYRMLAKLCCCCIKTSIIPSDYDLYATLQCKEDKLMINNIMGDGKNELIGDGIDEKNLNDLLAVDNTNTSEIINYIKNFNKSSSINMVKIIKIVNQNTKMVHIVEITISKYTTKNEFNMYMKKIASFNELTNENDTNKNENENDTNKNENENENDTKKNENNTKNIIDEPNSKNYVRCFVNFLKFIRANQCNQYNITLNILSVLSITNKDAEELYKLILTIVKNNKLMTNIILKETKNLMEIHIILTHNKQTDENQNEQTDENQNEQTDENKINICSDEEIANKLLDTINQNEHTDKNQNEQLNLLITVPGYVNTSQYLLSLEEIKKILSSNKKILLLLEDSNVIMKLLCKKLCGTFPECISARMWQAKYNDQYDLIICTNGVAGMEATILKEPDLIISDIEMPEIRGIELVKILRDHNINTHIMINSSNDKDKITTELKNIIGIVNAEFDIYTDLNLRILDEKNSIGKQYINDHLEKINSKDNILARAPSNNTTSANDQGSYL